MLSSFKEEQKKLIDAYNKLIEFEFVPLKSKNITEEDIKESIQELRDEKFIVSFCGQIKAGKSTLLNALLFGDEILPAASTPHTAKITIINYAEEPYFEVVYYSEEEWKDLKATLKAMKIDGDVNSTTYFDKYLKPQINQSISQGIYEDEIIGKAKETVKDLSRLDEFVGAKGKFMPFVKEIHLFYPNDILKQITIVDTPGTNDPNPYRSKITEDWIHKSNAIVYVVYAGQAFSKVDIDFIDKYLVGVDPQLLVFAINKMDMVDEEEIKVWVNKVREDDRLKARMIMQKEDSIVYVSGLGGLIRKLIDSGKFENSRYAEDEEFIEMLDESGWIAEPGLSELERIIEKKILTSKAKKIISAHKAKIKGIMIDKIREVKEDIYSLSEKRKIYNLDRSQIEEKLKELSDKKADLRVKSLELRDKFAGILAEFEDNLLSYLKERWNDAFLDIKKGISEFSDIESIKSNTRPLVINTLKELSKGLMRGIIESPSSPVNLLIDKVREELEDFERSFRGNFVITAGIKFDIYQTISMDLENLINKAENVVLNKVNEASKLGIWGTIKFWEREEQVESIKKKLPLEINNAILEQFIESLHEEIGFIVRNRMESLVNKFIEDMQKEFYEIEQALNKTKDSLEKNRKLLEKLDRQLNGLENVLRKYKELAKEISSYVGVEIEEL